MPERLTFNPKQYIKKGESFALWRLPHTSQVKAVVSDKVLPFMPHLLEQNTIGFAFAPFDAEGDTPSFFIEGDIVEIDTTLLKTATSDYFLWPLSVVIDAEENYVANVALAVKSIQAGMLKKVVVARNIAWHIPESFDPVMFFNRLCENYPEALISLVSIQGMGTWIGATPELLLKTDEKQLTTVALAGTQLKNHAFWTEKESEEQLWVVRYIEDILDLYQVSQLDISARKQISNGDLQHLYTQINFKKEGTPNNSLAAHLLPRLHPTPAVCGLGKAEALQFIKNYELFDRSYYSGFLGEVNKANSDLYVNLRCMQLTQNQLVGYAGAGITIDSNPELEFEETENKLNNLKSLLK